MDYQSIINDISDEVSSLLRAGKVADYIPALAGVNPEQFAMTLTLFDGTQYSVGRRIHSFLFRVFLKFLVLP